MADSSQPPQGRSNNHNNIVTQAISFARRVATGQHWLARLVPAALWLLDALLCWVIIKKIPYTEIDWTAYMEQVQQVVDGERDYANIRGGTGPLVYPAAHVWTYEALYYVTDHGKNILLAQDLFAGLYLLTLAVVMLCYRNAKV